MLAAVLGNPATPAPVVRPSIDDVLLAVEPKYAEWAEPQLIEQIAARVTGPDPATIAATIEQVLVEAMASAEVVELAPPSEPGDTLRPPDGRPVEMTPSAVRYTSVRHLQRELAVVDWATSTNHRGHRAVPGAGKTRMLAAAVDAWQTAGIVVFGATSAFDDLVADEVAWTDHVTVEVVVQRLASHSAHRLLEPDQSAAVNEALHHELGAPTDVIDLSYTTHIFTAARR